MFRPLDDRPLPAAVDGRTWSVRPSTHEMTGATETRRAEMYAPLLDTPTARMIRAHELIHAKVTPRVSASDAAAKGGCTIEALQWAEDYRVNRIARRKRLIPDAALTEAECDSIAESIAGHERYMAGALLCHADTPEQSDRLADSFIRAGVCPGVVASIVDRVESIVRGAVAGLSKATRRRSRFRGGRQPACISKPLGFRKLTLPLARLFDVEFPEGGRPGDRADGETAEGRKVARDVELIPGMSKWAPVSDIIRLPMPHAAKPRRPIGKRFADTGVVPSAVHRITTDGAIFATKRRAKGGTVLCDASGSMSYDDEDIDRLLREAPGSTIAFYAGGGRHGGEPHGRIVVAAHRGRRADVDAVTAALPGSENYIDGPALRWLARQPAPRFWISDEQVGGGGGSFGIGSTAHHECLAICRAANITIVPHIDALRR